MKPDENLKTALEKRALELVRIIRQMKLDHLHRSTVCKNLEDELHSIQGRLTPPFEVEARK